MNTKDVNYNYDDDSLSPGSIVLKVIIVIVCLSIILAIAFDVINHLKKRQVTEGLEPLEVVELFYWAVNKGDIDTLAGCINSKKITPMNNRNIINPVLNIRRNYEEFTHGGKQLGLEGTIYLPSDWITQGKKELKPGERVEGIYNVVIMKIANDQFRVNYDYYYTYTGKDIMNPIPRVINYSDICMLVQNNGNWIIDKIEQFGD